MKLGRRDLAASDTQGTRRSWCKLVLETGDRGISDLMEAFIIERIGILDVGRYWYNSNLFAQDRFDWVDKSFVAQGT